MAFPIVKNYVHEIETIELKRIFETTLFYPISVITPAHNEAETISESVKSFLQLEYPQFEVIVVNDGSTDETIEVLKKQFNLKKSYRTVLQQIKTKPIRQLYTSTDYPELVVVDKENGGKADSLNAGINVSRYPLVCILDADSILERSSLLKASRPFIERPETVISGGIVRIANGCRIEAGEVLSVGLPKDRLVKFQVVEYLRAFLFGRVAWSYFNALLIVSGAFGIFKKSVVIEVGGYNPKTVGEDMELVVRTHRILRKKKRPYRITFVPDPVCWTEAPTQIAYLGKQRNRWQRGLFDSLFFNRQMIFNPRYGIVGLGAMPFFLLMEFFGPLVEFSGYFVFALSVYFHLVHLLFTILFLLVAIGLGVILSVGSLVLEELTFHRYPKVSDVVNLYAYGFLENFGYRQAHTWWRVRGIIERLLGKESWGEMKRESFS